MKNIIAITGSTGGLGRLVCLELVKDNALVLVDRNIEKSKALARDLLSACPAAEIDFITCDLANVKSVKNAADALIDRHIDVLMLNSGVYNVPVFTCETGYNNIFQINFLSQYYIARTLAENSATLKKVTLTSSVAHRYGTLDPADPDYSTRKKPSLIYGNSKRFLTFSAYEYFKDCQGIKLSVAHPGVTLTNMTNHYPKFINPIVKLGIKLFFPSPKKAIKSLVRAADDECGYGEWIGPSVFDVWGKPKKSALKNYPVKESREIARLADKMYARMSEEF